MFLNMPVRRKKTRNRRILHGRLIYARPSFLRGVARLFDFGGTLNTYYYLQEEDPNEADARAIASDWEAVGKDIADAIEKYGATVNRRVVRRR